MSRSRIVFEVTIEGEDAADGSDEENVENIVDCIYEATGSGIIKITAKVLRREFPESS